MGVKNILTNMLRTLLTVYIIVFDRKISRLPKCKFEFGRFLGNTLSIKRYICNEKENRFTELQ